MRRPTTVIAVALMAATLPGCSRTATPPPATTGPAAARPAATGAVQALATDTLGGRHVADVAEMLQGRVPGLQVIRLGNGDISLRIRQNDSILSTGEPLLILDGAPVAEQNLSLVLRQLNPNEIDTIDVLRDVASTSVYGEKGAHGVIIIRMKRKQ
jgi:TonB-dependent SusC/RagA subfamily outer membrane receptor